MTPLCLKGKIQGMPDEGPPTVVQVVPGVFSTSHTEVSQSPHLLVTVVPFLSTRVEHQGEGELA